MLDWPLRRWRVATLVHGDDIALFVAEALASLFEACNVALNGCLNICEIDGRFVLTSSQ